ncbi:hypothetical protein ACFXPX_13450, partial [Kitasatospora sp. NPDC059146]|uniref:hypothetical protein n=1 Tax=Kitasatospora sp. NPDC059146 TaxID=3346741 RepID=UPI003676242D
MMHLPSQSAIGFPLAGILEISRSGFSDSFRIPLAEFNSRACAGILPERSEGIRCPAACRRDT